MSAKTLAKEARKAMGKAGQNFIALAYDAKHGPGYWVNQDGVCILRCSTDPKNYSASELRSAFAGEGLNINEALSGLYHVTQK